MRPVLQYVRRLAGGVAVAGSDAQLLREYAATRAEEPFATLVGRYGAMVLGVCRRVLGEGGDADDAFQATFLVLARKAGAGVWRESVGGWLGAAGSARTAGGEPAHCHYPGESSLARGATNPR